MSVARLVPIVALAVLAGACSSDGSVESAPTTEPAATSTTSSATTTDAPTSSDPRGPATTDEPEPVATTDPATSTSAPPCTAPVDELRFVEVERDDPDGGLNMRTAPGVENDIVAVFPRSSELITMGGCALRSTFEWWEVRSPDGSMTGWVSSRFLSELPVFDPGPGAPFVDDDNVGLESPTLDALASELATIYGFDDDATLAVVGVPTGLDAQGGETTYEARGLKDDAIDGFRFDIGFAIVRDDDDEIVAFRVVTLSVIPLCRRGVTDDGLCV